ncbi:hypothetical protein [Moritella sp. F3]|uniref:hypothetical protein n=1 Tax=Moritella sp. F3 TaxID=2718882 RepID=UPI0018E15E56|nr:hypothetical protein [Moritella sp. F3]GIC77187.1 hypothetical protein FMO001_19140 [Moritella sp. F1]GIC82306.1 hypothetical protein FMO003_25870 [Moritella sp. F3]
MNIDRNILNMFIKTSNRYNLILNGENDSHADNHPENVGEWRKEHPGTLDDLPIKFLNQLLDLSFRKDSHPYFIFKLSEHECFLFGSHSKDPDCRDIAVEKRFYISISNQNRSEYGDVNDYENVLFTTNYFEDLVVRFEELIDNRLQKLLLNKAMSLVSKLWSIEHVCITSEPHLKELNETQGKLINELIHCIDDKNNQSTVNGEMLSKEQVASTLTEYPFKFINYVAIESSADTGETMFILNECAAA